MADYEPEITSKSSKINSAMIVNITLNNLFNDFYKHFRAGTFLSANNDLDCIWTILGGEPDVEDSDTEKDFEKIDLELIKIGNLNNGIECRGFNKITTETVKKINSQKKVLIKKARFLKMLQNTQGKGTAYQSDDEDDFD